MRTHAHNTHKHTQPDTDTHTHTHTQKKYINTHTHTHIDKRERERATEREREKERKREREREQRLSQSVNCWSMIQDDPAMPLSILPLSSHTTLAQVRVHAFPLRMVIPHYFHGYSLPTTTSESSDEEQPLIHKRKTPGRNQSGPPDSASHPLSFLTSCIRR